MPPKPGRADAKPTYVPKQKVRALCAEAECDAEAKLFDPGSEAGLCAAYPEADYDPQADCYAAGLQASAEFHPKVSELSTTSTLLLSQAG